MTKITRRMAVTGVLVAAALSSLPGRAHDVTAFAVITTSVDGGFASVNPIAARFNHGVNLTASTGALRDRSGDAVTTVLQRTSSGSGPDGDSLVLTPNYNQLDELHSPYTLTLNAVESVLPGGTAETVTVTREFWLDLTKGAVAITTPSNPKDPHVVAPGETLRIAGWANDDYKYDTIAGTLVPRTANRSGLGSVEIRLYKLNPTVRSLGSVNPGPPPSVTPPLIQPSQEVTALRHSAALSDPTRVNAVDGEKTWTANLAGVTQGSWTLQAVSIDKAGNRSATSETSFIIT